MAIGIGSVHGLDSPFTAGEPLCVGPLPLAKLECGAIGSNFEKNAENLSVEEVFRPCFRWKKSGGKKRDWLV